MPHRRIVVGTVVCALALLVGFAEPLSWESARFEIHAESGVTVSLGNLESILRNRLHFAGVEGVKIRAEKHRVHVRWRRFSARPSFDLLTRTGELEIALAGLVGDSSEPHDLVSKGVDNATGRALPDSFYRQLFNRPDLRDVRRVDETTLEVTLHEKDRLRIQEIIQTNANSFLSLNFDGELVGFRALRVLDSRHIQLQSKSDEDSVAMEALLLGGALPLGVGLRLLQM